jgi:hypothetical protein
MRAVTTAGIVGGAFASLCLSAAAADAPARPNLTTIHGLYQACLDQYLSLYCTGYVAGVGDSMHASAAALEAKPDIHLNIDWCPPASTANAQLVQAFKTWHDQHPDSGQGAAVAGVTAALQATWPCPAPQPAPDR